MSSPSAPRRISAESLLQVVDGVAEGRITESNGFNCAQGPSAYRTPCLTRKAGLLEIVRDAVDRRGHPKPLGIAPTDVSAGVVG